MKACNLLEHYKRYQTLVVQHRGDEGLSFANIEDGKGEDDKPYNPTCYKCGEKGHYKRDCPLLERNKKKDKSGTTLATTEDGDTSKLNIVVGEEESNWADAEYGSEDEFSFANVSDAGNRNKWRVPVNWLLLDSQSTVGVICNPHIVKNIWLCPDGFSVTIHCNAGTHKVEMVADLNNYVTVWFNPGAIAKILSLAWVARRFRVSFDRKEGVFFKVHSKTRDIVFHRSSNGLYFH